VIERSHYQTQAHDGKEGEDGAKNDGVCLLNAHFASSSPE